MKASNSGGFFARLLSCFQPTAPEESPAAQCQAPPSRPGFLSPHAKTAPVLHLGFEVDAEIAERQNVLTSVDESISQRRERPRHSTPLNVSIQEAPRKSHKSFKVQTRNSVSPTPYSPSAQKNSDTGDNLVCSPTSRILERRSNLGSRSVHTNNKSTTRLSSPSDRDIIAKEVLASKEAHPAIWVARPKAGNSGNYSTNNKVRTAFYGPPRSLLYVYMGSSSHNLPSVWTPSS